MPIKTNRVPQDVEEMSFKRLTIVLNKPDAEKSFSPVNSEAVLVAVKSAEDKSGIAKAFDALKSLIVGDPPMVTPLIAKKDDDGDGDDGLTAGNSASDTDADDVADTAAAAAAAPAGQGVVQEAQHQGVYSALFNSVADLHSKLADIHHSPQLADKDKKKKMADAIAEHSVKTTALAGAMYSGKKAAKAFEEAAKAGARHSAADMKDLQDAHDHLTDTHDKLRKGIDQMTAAQEAVAKAKEHTGKLLGISDAMTHSDSATGATKSTEDDMTEEQVAALSKSLALAVATGVSEAMKAQTAAVTAEPKPVNNATLISEISAALMPAIEAVKAEVATAVDAASKAAADAAKSDIEKLDEQLKAKTAEKAAADAEAAKAATALQDAVKAARGRQAMGGHQDGALDAEKGGQKPRTSQEIVNDLPPKAKLQDAISQLLHSPTITR